MDGPKAMMRMRRQARYAHFLLNHVVGNRLRRTIRRSLLKPFCVTYHITDRNHIGRPAPGQSALDGSGEASLAEALTLLKKVRKEVKMLYLAGGEPLLHPAIGTIIPAAGRMGFAPLVLRTDFSLIDEHESLLRHCHLFVVPLETVNAERQATRWGCDHRWVERLIRNLVRYGPRQGELGFRLVIECVIGGETVKGACDLMGFCFDNNLLFAPTTSATLDRPDRRLKGEPAYERLVDYIVARKKAGAPILGSPESLRRLLALEDLSCHPTLAPHLAPNGEVFYPCLTEGFSAGNLLSQRTLTSLSRNAGRSLRPWHEEAHDCRLQGQLTTTWMLEHFLERPIEALTRFGK